jgi:hypothetical protein
MMTLLEIFIEIVSEWTNVFAQQRTTKRAIRQTLVSLICFGRRTLTRIIWATGNEQKSWSAEYFVHSRSPWSPHDLFVPILKRAVQFCRGRLVGVVVDDTSVKKTGKTIKQVFMSRDPMSPPFHPNLRLGIRFLHFAIVIPLHRTIKMAARTVPIRFEEVGVAKKPRKGTKDYKRKVKTFKEAKKTHNLTVSTVKALSKIRELLDLAGAAKKIAVIIGDGAFCNRRIFSYAVERMHLLLRCRKDIKLCRRSTLPRRFYARKVFTPSQILNNESIAWQKVRIFFGGKYRIVQFKEITNVLWPTGAKRRFLRLFVLQPTKYRVRKTGKLESRDPGFLLTTLIDGQTQNLLQLYFDRWQIEVNHRELKDTLHVGQAQLHNPVAVPKQPALVVAGYSAMLLASLIAYGPERTEVYHQLPRWRGNAKRPSCLDLTTLLRKQLVENTSLQDEMGAKITFSTLASAAAA